MKTLLFSMFCSLSLSSFAQQVYLNAGALYSKNTLMLVVCGSDKVRIVDASKSNAEHAEIIWEWNASNTRKELGSSTWESRFAKMDECKPVLNNSKLLVTASSNGAMIIDIASKTCDFYAVAPMAHSAELLPNNRLIVAESTHKQGDALEVFDLSSKTGTPIIRDSMTSAHGVVYMPESQRLYAIGSNAFRIYKLDNWTTASPKLTLERQLKIPVGGAHDLTRINDHQLLISCSSGVYYYDLKTNTISSYKPLDGYSDLKSVNIVNEQQIIYTHPEESWWTFHISSINPAWSIPMPDINMYKVRVFQKEP